MKIEFDPGKNERNVRERKLPFAMAAVFDWENAIVVPDKRWPYPERRLVAYGLIGDRMHVVCFTPIPGSVRVISLRKANDREIRRYAQKTAN